MKVTFAVGNRVEISKNYHWAKSVTGEIMHPPNYIIKMSDGWKGIVREVNSLRGILLFYWVKFDKPQIDADGDGTYHEAEIESEYLKLFE